MPISPEPFVFLKEFCQFSQESMKWCMQESEKEATNVYGVIKALIEDLNRRSKMSEKTMSAMKDMESVILKFLTDKDPNKQFSELITELRILISNNQEIQKLVNPIVECLQFQDRLRQNLENICKIMDVWLETRGDENQLVFKTEQEITEFGEQLLACTTSQEERDCIRLHIKGLAPERKVERAMLF